MIDSNAITETGSSVRHDAIIDALFNPATERMGGPTAIGDVLDALAEHHRSLTHADVSDQEAT